jgi:hypothetical protein
VAGVLDFRREGSSCANRLNVASQQQMSSLAESPLHQAQYSMYGTIKGSAVKESDVRQAARRSEAGRAYIEQTLQAKSDAHRRNKSSPWLSVLSAFWEQRAEVVAFALMGGDADDGFGEPHELVSHLTSVIEEWPSSNFAAAIKFVQETAGLSTADAGKVERAVRELASSTDVV